MKEKCNIWSNENLCLQLIKKDYFLYISILHKIENMFKIPHYIDEHP